MSVDTEFRKQRNSSMRDGKMERRRENSVGDGTWRKAFRDGGAMSFRIV